MFARDAATASYYDQRAVEYDEWYLGLGLYAHRDRPGWSEDVARLESFVAALDPATNLDIACGTGFLTRHLSGEIVGIDQSPSMVEIASGRIPRGEFRVGDALALPFPDGAFDRVFTSHFYGHLPPDEREAFMAEASRVADELVVVDAAIRPGVPKEAWQERVLNDGTRHRVYKRYFTARQLAEEIDGVVLLESDWFVAARVRWEAQR
ncbi:MAG TPA: class I SAM-dependent methyltransferase [Acidimicrobiales bacterium]